MKLGPVTKFDKKNKTTSEKNNEDIILANCDVIIIFPNLWPIWSHLEAGFRKHSL